MERPCVCDECGGELPSHAPEGLCPACLLRTGAAEWGLRITAAPAADPPPAPGPGSQPERTAKPGGRFDSTGIRLGDYELLALIGQGGMGMVYRARQISLDRIVALKLLPFGQFSRDEVVERFRAEASAAGSLQHPNIVAIHEVGEHEGQHYFSMDFVEGQTLADLVRAKPLPAKRAAGILQTIATAVHHAHRHGILHRDLKPSNILIDAAGQPRITDFGLAKRMTVDSEMTVTGQILGSPSFISPEQAEGRQKEVGPASDIYALGGLLYHMLTRQPPFQSDTLTTLLKQVIEREPVAPALLNPAIPQDLETICLKCLEKDIARRYPTAQALADDLGRFLEGEPIQARPVGVLGKGWKWCRRRPVLAGLAGSLAASVLLGTAGVLWQWRQTLAANTDAHRREYAANIGLVQSLIGDKKFDRAREILADDAPELYRNWEWGWLQRQCNQDLMTLPARTLVVAIDPSSRFLATQGGANAMDMVLWDLAAGQIHQTLVGHTGGVYRAAFSRDGRQLATSSPWDTRAIIWDLANSQESASLVHTQGVRDICYSPDGQRLATACLDGRVRLWDTRRWAQIDESPPYGDHLVCLKFSPDGRRIAYGGGYMFEADSRNTAVCIWDLTSRKVQPPLPGHTQAVTGVAWHPDGKQLASCSIDGQVILWDPASGQRLRSLAPGARRGALFSLEFSPPDGRSLAIAGVEVPSLNAWAQVLETSSLGVRNEFSGHSRRLSCLAFSPDGRQLATAAADGQAKVWLADPWPPYLSLAGHDQPVSTVAFSPDGHFLATGSLDQTAKIWDAQTGVLLRTIPVEFPVISLAFSPTGTQLATTGPDQAACVWPIPGLRLQKTSAPGPLRRLPGHAGAVLAVGWSPDNRWLATGGKDHQAILWNAEAGQVHRPLIGHTNWVLALAFSPNSQLLATGSADATIRIWDVHAGQCLRTLNSHAGGVLSLAFSPDGRLLATGGGDQILRLWEVGSGRELQAIQTFANGVTSVAFSPDGARLLVAASGPKQSARWNQESRIRLLDVATGQELLSFVAHSNHVYGAAFSPDGQRLATGSADNTARIWTAFPWQSAAYAGQPGPGLAAGIEAYKRRFWQTNQAVHQAADPVSKETPWPRRLGVNSRGDYNLPPAGSKTRPMRPIPPRSAQAGAGQLDLTASYNVALNESWQSMEILYQVDLNLAALPAGLQTFQKSLFDVRGLIQLRRRSVDHELFPERTPIPVRRAFTRLHALHGTRWEEEEGMTIAELVLRYQDGAAETVPIVFGEHLRHEKARRDADGDFDIDNHPECTQGTVAWLGPAPERPGEVQLRLYKTTFPNPRPAVEVVQIEYISKVTRSAPYLVALTVE